MASPRPASIMVKLLVAIGFIAVLLVEFWVGLQKVQQIDSHRSGNHTLNQSGW